MWWIIALGCFRKSESFVISEVCANQRLHWAHTTLCSYLRLTKYHIPTAFQKPLELTEAFRQYTRRLMKDRPLNWKNTSIYLFIYLYLLYCAISPLSPLKCEKHRKKKLFFTVFLATLNRFYLIQICVSSTSLVCGHKGQLLCQVCFQFMLWKTTSTLSFQSTWVHVCQQHKTITVTC